MKPAAISLLEYFATDLVLGTNPSFRPDQPLQFEDKDLVIAVDAKQDATAPRNGKRWQVTLDVRHQPAADANFPYSYRVVLVGQFGVGENVKPEDEERWAKIHASSVLYGMAREIVRALTGRGPYRPVILPTVSFYEQGAAPKPTAPAVAPIPAPKRRTPKRSAGK
jgi:preprotein translocase subunit SecB